MIAIDDSTFEWDRILQIYGETGKLTLALAEKMNDARPHLGTLAKQYFDSLFYEHGVLEQAKISHFLLSPKPNEIIWEYAKWICDQLWGRSDFADALLHWKTAVNRAVDSPHREERAGLLSRYISGQSKTMFEWEGHPLRDCDLNANAKRNTLFSSKSRLTTLRLSKQREIEEFKKDCEEVFDYDRFSQKYRNDILAAMHIRVCPYCNRQYITLYNSENGETSTADVDHFYCKDSFPFLAISLYNFVPSCQICNSRFKGKKDFADAPHIYPYQRGFGDDANFRLRNIEAIIKENEKPEFLIEPWYPDEEIERSIDTFHLNEVYGSHTDYVAELIRKARIYSDSQLQEYLTIFPKLFDSKEEMQRILYGNYLRKEDLGKRPLAKLTRDLLLDLGIKIDE